MRWLLLLLLTLLAACGKEEDPIVPPYRPPPPVRTDETPPLDRVLVDHILVSFEGADPAIRSFRPQEKARRLAYSLLERVRGGADFRSLKAEFSDDRHELTGEPRGPYVFCNFGVEHKLRADGLTELPRSSMAKAWGDLAFSLRPGEFGIVDYHARHCSVGWVVLVRLR